MSDQIIEVNCRCSTNIKLYCPGYEFCGFYCQRMKMNMWRGYKIDAVKRADGSVSLFEDIPDPFTPLAGKPRRKKKVA